ncbi:MAG: hypothetical protein WC100_04160 [Sterolibacterium sp.]
MLTVTMTPAANASAASDVCAYHGTLTTSGPGGHVDMVVSGGYTNRASAGSGTAALSSTLTISADLESAYSMDQIRLAAEVQAAENLAGQGYSCSGEELTTLTNLKESHVQSFLNEAIVNIRLVKSTRVIDKTAIDKLLYAYQTQDLAWVSTSNSGNCGFSAIDLAATGYVSRINTYYSNLIVQINAL